MSYKPAARYQINKQDEIIFVDDAWNQFAEANEGPELISDRVLGRSLWDFITDATTCHLYRQILTRARQGHRVRFNLRCDGPTCRRDLEMTISEKVSGIVELATQVIRVAEREPVSLLARSSRRSDELLTACAWCNKIAVGPTTWAEVEDAIVQLGLFEAVHTPTLTHGICEICFTSMDSIVTNLQPDA